MPVSNPAPLVKVENLSYSTRGASILLDVSFEIGPSDFLAVIGPNGCGKSTLLKLILGLLKPTKGEILLLGKPLRQFHEWTQIGYVAQKATHIDPYFPVSVKEVLAMRLLADRRPPALLTPKDITAIDLALEKVGVLHLKKRMIGELSGGEQQRVFIARAIVHNPVILFLDEPTTGIDAATRTQFYSMLNELKHNAMAIVLVTHDIGVVTKHVNKLACLNQHLYFHGTHKEFCQCEAQNFIPGRDHFIDHDH